LQSPYITNQIAQSIEIGDRLLVAHFWTFDAQLLGLTIDAFSAPPLVVDGAIERTLAIEGQAHLASELCEAYSQEHQEERTYRLDRFIAVSAAQFLEHPILQPSRLPYKHPSHPEVRIRLTARSLLLMERNPYFSDAIQPLGEEQGLLCFRWPPAENDWLARLLLSFGPDAEVLAPPSLRNLVREMAQEIADRHNQQ
jgi:hypothetical protein